MTAAFSPSLLALAVLALPAAAQETTLGRLLAESHVHGIAMDPGDPMRLILATHGGLYAANLLSRRAEPLSDGTKDLMGFVPVPGEPGAFLASGHPATGGNLGVVRSVDGGATWEALSPGANGPVDFHQMAASLADPALVWGVQHGVVLQRSGDGGATWEAVGPAPAGVIDLAASPTDPATLYAATEAGLRVSRDGGASWEAAHPAAAPVSVVEAAPDGRILAFVVGEGLLAATEPDLAWQAPGAWAEQGAPLHLAIDPANPDRMVAATTDGRLLISATGGQTWSLVAGPGA